MERTKLFFMSGTNEKWKRVESPKIAINSKSNGTRTLARRKIQMGLIVVCVIS